MKLKQEIFAARRQKLMEKIGSDSIIIIPSAMAKQRNADNEHVFRQDSSFYYLTGFTEPNAIAVLIPNADGGKYILFNRAHQPDMEAFVGVYVGQDGAIAKFGADESYDIETIGQKLPDLFKPFSKIYYPIGGCHEFYPIQGGTHLEDLINQAFRKRRELYSSGYNLPFSLHDASALIHQMRLIKEPAEIALIQTAVDITVQAHVRTMQAAASEKTNEMTLSAQFMSEIMHHNTQEVAYPNVVGAGKHSCTLHYQKNDTAINDGDIVLMDAGAEYEQYASDITRTFPMNGKFSPEQRAVYEVVLTAQEACIKAAKPGVSLADLQRLSAREVTLGLINLRILKGELEDLLQTRAYSKFYMHGLGHWLGLDVHDTGMISRRTPFKPGMVFTIEPGIYIAQPEEVDAKWHNIGIRIEDDVLITENGCEVLSKSLPTQADDIEKLMTGWVPPGIAKLGFQRHGFFGSASSAAAKEPVREEDLSAKLH